jgi:hypothetical protein
MLASLLGNLPGSHILWRSQLWATLKAYPKTLPVPAGQQTGGGLLSALNGFRKGSNLGEFYKVGASLRTKVMRWIDERRRIIGLALVMGGLILLGLKAWQVVATVRSLLSRVAQVQAMAQGSATHIDPAAVGALVMGARADVTTLRADLGPLVQLAPRLGWLPGVGGDAQAAPALLEMADGLTEAGAELWQGFAPLLDKSASADDAPMSQKALAQLVAARPRIERAQAALDRAAAARATIQVEQLSSKLASQMRKLDALLPLAQVGVDVALTAPEALGQGGLRTYLILAQNEDELRPTGGFISAAGRMTFDHGRLAEFSFMDSKAVDDPNQPFPTLPEPMAQYLGLGQLNELWLFRDSNWSPDFPTSAKQAAYFYTYGQKVPVDGVLAVDQHAVQMLIAALGPMTIPIGGEQTTVITSDNVVEMMREAWNPPGGNATAEWIATRKGFIGRLAAALRARVENDPGSVSWPAVGRAMLQALDERQILVYVAQPDLAQVLARQGWDGAIRPTESDYLLVSDANLGYNKANASIGQSVRYTVDLANTADVQATLRVDYQHASQPGEPCRQEQPYGPGITYQSMMGACYYDYLRVYVPRGAQLHDASHQSIPASYFLSGLAVDSQAQVLEPEVGKSVFASFFVVEPGKNWQTFFDYGLPAGVVRRVGSDWQYSLWLQKQSGKPVIPTVVTLNLPSGAKVIYSSPRPTSMLASQLQFEFPMTQDTYIEVRFD